MPSNESPDAASPSSSTQSTAKRAAEILVAKGEGFTIPTAAQRQILLVAFAKKGKLVYGKAFDVVKGPVDAEYNDSQYVETHLSDLTIYEIKSTRKDLPPDFSGYFFALTAAELLVAQSLKKQFRFAFVNTRTEDYIECELSEIFARRKGFILLGVFLSSDHRSHELSGGS